MDINRANLDALFNTYNTAWGQVFDTSPGYADIAFMVQDFPSTTASNFYAWLDKVPGFRKWVGDRVVNNVRSNKFEVLNEDFEDSIALSVNDIEDDQFGMYTPIIQMMAQSWFDMKRSQLIEVLTGNATTFTGKALVADDHAYGDYTIDNKATGALTAATFTAALLAASQWQYSNGELIKPRFTHLIVGEKMRNTAWNIVENQYVANTGSSTTHTDVTIENANKGRCKLVVLPELADTYDDYWYLVDASRPVKLLALQSRKEPVPMMDTDPIRLQMDGETKFLASGRMAAAPTFPHLVYGGIL